MKSPPEADRRRRGVRQATERFIAQNAPAVGEESRRPRTTARARYRGGGRRDAALFASRPGGASRLAPVGAARARSGLAASATRSSPRSSPPRTRVTSSRSLVDEDAVRSLTERVRPRPRRAPAIAVATGADRASPNLGLRGSDAWIGGVGVVPSERRRGTGRALMRGGPGGGTAARRRAHVWLRGDRREHAGDQHSTRTSGTSRRFATLVSSRALVGAGGRLSSRWGCRRRRTPGSASTAPAGSLAAGRRLARQASTRPRAGSLVEGAAAVVRVTGARVQRRAARAETTLA